ncbi:Hypothetical protein NGAL_HAMBI490_26560 [Neorhizobium galegae bv. officinalis]|nr:Hypothetical protein NGAL_HAMBI490_26560 [Neorhizobium galegae bv. officinalis]
MTRGTIPRRPEARQPTTAALPALTDRARRDGTSIESELFHRGQIDEAAYYGGMAPYLRLPFIAAIDPGSVADIPRLDSQLHRPNQIRINHLHKAPQAAVVPEAGRLADLKAALLAMPLLGQDLAITAPSATRRAVWRSGAARRVRETINGLFDGSAPVLGPRGALMLPGPLRRSRIGRPPLSTSSSSARRTTRTRSRRSRHAFITQSCRSRHAYSQG